MPASITLSKISWSTPDGRAILTDIDASFEANRTGLIGRNGVGKSTLFSIITGALEPSSGTVSVTGKLGFLRQSVQDETGLTLADLFDVREALRIIERAEQGVASQAELARADWTLEARIAQALARTGLSAGPQTPLSHLSGGQRTRARLASLIFNEPDFLLLDEPTNNLDRDGQRAVIDLLGSWTSGAIVVSHDRAVLDALDEIMEITSLGAKRYGGNWSFYREQKATELAAAQRALDDARKRTAEIAISAQKARERQEKRNAGGQRKRARGDMPRILLNARKNTSEQTAGAQSRLADRRREQAEMDQQAAQSQIEVLTPFAVTLASTGLPTGRTVLKLDTVTTGYRKDNPILHDLTLEVAGPERIAVTGPNGSGKTTLLNVLCGRIEPQSGSVRVEVAYVLLDQGVSFLDPSLSILDNYRALNPQDDNNGCRAALARFMFRADAALQKVGTLSGGQMLRAGLACTLGSPNPPQLLILDEPTNHLDLDSVETLEAGLRAYDGALIVVSHDEYFLDAIGIERHIDLGKMAKTSPPTT